MTCDGLLNCLRGEDERYTLRVHGIAEARSWASSIAKARQPWRVKATPSGMGKNAICQVVKVGDWKAIRDGQIRLYDSELDKIAKVLGTGRYGPIPLPAEAPSPEASLQTRISTATPTAAPVAEGAQAAPTVTAPLTPRRTIPAVSTNAPATGEKRKPIEIRDDSPSPLKSRKIMPVLIVE